MVGLTPVYECKLCPQKTTTWDGMLGHIRDRHANVIMGDYCQVVHVPAGTQFAYIAKSKQSSKN